jgi:hypothetical protein
MTRTADQLLARCEPYGDCLLWTGGLANKGGTPRIYENKKPISVRRVIYEARHGEIRNGYKIVPCCGERLCLEPDHLRARSVAQLLADHNRCTGGLTPSHVAALTARARNRSSNKMTLERAREIRASTEPSRKLADKHGVCRALICRIKRGECWAETTRGASIFCM